MDCNVYFRDDSGTLGRIKVSDCGSHKEAILLCREHLVAQGDCLTNKAVLAAIEGGKKDEN